jgi:hypothetical protein
MHEGAPSVRRSHRIAVIGEAGFDVRAGDAVVRCFPWNFSGETSEIADYDVAVVNLAEAGPQEDSHGAALPKEIDGERVSAILDALNRMISAGGEVVVIGRPEISFWWNRRSGGQGNWASKPYWTGMRLEWDRHAGDRVQLGEFSTPFTPYVQQISRYEYSLVRVMGEDVYPPTPPSHSPFLPGAHVRPVGTMKVVTEPLLTNRHGGMVASIHRVSSPLSPAGQSPGTVVLLPSLPGGAKESVTNILRDVYTIPVASPDAPWLKGFRAPGEAAVLIQMEKVQAEIDVLQAQSGWLEEQRMSVRRSLGLLSLGDAGLEEQVRAALRCLGADVEEPSESKEDGWITVRLPEGMLHGVLEIKSTQKPVFDQYGLKQLVDWKARGMSQRGIAYKGIFIGNSAYGMTPDDRPDPFEVNFRKAAITSELVALTTATLLRELTRVVDDAESSDTFWRALFTTNGVYE